MITALGLLKMAVFIYQYQVLFIVHITNQKLSKFSISIHVEVHTFLLCLIMYNQTMMNLQIIQDNMVMSYVQITLLKRNLMDSIYPIFMLFLSLYSISHPIHLFSILYDSFHIHIFIFIILSYYSHLLFYPSNILVLLFLFIMEQHSYDDKIKYTQSHYLNILM